MTAVPVPVLVTGADGDTSIILAAPSERGRTIRAHGSCGVAGAVLAVHKVEAGGEYCQEDGFRWPCRTARAVWAAA